MLSRELKTAIGLVIALCFLVALAWFLFRVESLQPSGHTLSYQYLRPEDALAIKLKLYLEEEMRKWEKTFPDQLWEQFGRLTNWKGRIHQRPKYCGQLVMKLIYEYLDPEVARWLRENAPKPIHGQNYHEWLSSQYGLRKLIEHIWKVVGIASPCSDIDELKHKMGELYGRKPGFQFELKLVSGGGLLQ